MSESASGHFASPMIAAQRPIGTAQPWPPTSPPLIPPAPFPPTAFAPAPLPEDPGAPPNPPWWKRSLAGLPTLAWLGILGFTLLGLGTIIAVAARTDGYTNANPPPTEAKPTTTEVGLPLGDLGARDNPIPLGQPAELGEGWTMTVNAVDLDADARILDVNPYNEPAAEGRSYIVVNATLTYTGDEEPVDMFSISISAVGEGTNVESGEFTQNEFVVPPEPALVTFDDLYSGGSITGNVAFSVPDEDLSTLLIIGQSSYVTNEHVYFATS